MDWIYWIIITLFVLALVTAGIVAYRFRQYLQTGWFMLKTYRQFRQKTKPEKKSIEKKPISDNTPLIKCVSCQKWFSQEQGVKLKTSYFCSHDCLERSFTARK
jgi:hypothetical protein